MLCRPTRSKTCRRRCHRRSQRGSGTGCVGRLSATSCPGASPVHPVAALVRSVAVPVRLRTTPGVAGVCLPGSGACRRDRAEGRNGDKKTPPSRPERATGEMVQVVFGRVLPLISLPWLSGRPPSVWLFWPLPLFRSWRLGLFFRPFPGVSSSVGVWLSLCL